MPGDRARCPDRVSAIQIERLLIDRAVLRTRHCVRRDTERESERDRFGVAKHCDVPVASGASAAADALLLSAAAGRALRKTIRSSGSLQRARNCSSLLESVACVRDVVVTLHLTCAFRSLSTSTVSSLSPVSSLLELSSHSIRAAGQFVARRRTVERN